QHLAHALAARRRQLGVAPCLDRGDGALEKEAEDERRYSGKEQPGEDEDAEPARELDQPVNEGAVEAGGGGDQIAEPDRKADKHRTPADEAQREDATQFGIEDVA